MKMYLSSCFTIVLVLFVALSTASGQTCPGGSGCLDTSFGNGGFVAASLNGGVGVSWANSAAIQSDGKIVVAAESENAENTSAWDNYVLRFNSDGTPDASFGNGGVVRFAYTSAADHEFPWAIAIQPDGKIIVGSSIPGNLTGIARLNIDGTFDPTFGSGGRLTFNLVARQSALATAIVIQADGRIVIGLSPNNTGFGFVRLTSNGRLDTTLNGTGKLIVGSAKGNQTCSLTSLAIQPDGKYLAGGLMPGNSRGSTSQFTVMRVTSSGKLDSSFGSGGIVTTNFGGTWSIARNVVVLPDGKIVAGGDWLAGGTTGNQSFVVIRYLGNGQLDTSFGTGGKALFGSPDFRRMTGMAIQPDGKIVGSGWDRNPSVSNSNVAIFRIDAFGALDPTFGSGGMTFTDYNGLSDDGQDMIVQSDGKFVVAGVINGYGPGTSIGLYRYLP